MISRKYRKKLSLYQRFADKYGLFGETQMLECFNWETHGSYIDPKNGFAVGKKWLNVTLSMWKEDLRSGLLSVDEYQSYMNSLK